MEDTKLAVLIGAAILLFYLIITKRDPARASSHTALPKAIIIENIFGVAWRAKLAYNTNHLALYHQRHGKTFRLEPLFGTRQIISADPDNIYEILNGKDWGVGRRRDSMKDLVGQGMLVLEGDEWAKARRMYKPAFARKNLDDFGFLGALIDMVLEKIPGGGETVDLAPLLGDAFMDSSLRFVLDFDSRQTSDAPLTPRQFQTIWYKTLFAMGLRMLFGSSAWMLPKAHYLRLVCQVHAFVDFFVDRSSSTKSNVQSKGRQCMAETFFHHTDDKKYIQSQLTAGILASQDTTSTLLCNIIETLARYPEYWKELKDEVTEKDHEHWTYDALRDNRVIQNMLTESLRIRPVFAILGHRTDRDTTLPTGGGPDGKSPVFVPKDTEGLVNLYALHRDPSVFGSDVETFNPHRWNTIKPSPKEFLPFGVGGRTCLGKEKALVESAYVLVRLATEFESVEFRGKPEYRGRVQLTMRSADGCKVAFHRT